MVRDSPEPRFRGSIVHFTPFVEAIMNFEYSETAAQIGPQRLRDRNKIYLLAIMDIISLAGSLLADFGGIYNGYKNDAPTLQTPSLS